MHNKQEVIDKLGGKCVKCGDPDDLEFDHIERTSKKVTIGTLLLTRSSLAVLEEELSKCQLLCRSCHALKTREEKRRSPKVAKLTPEDVEDIRAMLSLGTMKQTAIARQYGVSNATISMIKTQARWRE